MSGKFARSIVWLTALALVLSACAPGGASVSSGGEEDFPDGAVGASSQRLEAIPVVELEPEPEPGPVLTQEDVDAALAEVMEEYTAAAVSVATVECGQLSQAGAWGWAVKNEREMSPDTKLRIASISKVVVGMCALAMAEEGIVDLEAPLSDYWGSGVRNPYSQGQPSIYTLMTHSSSVKDLEITRGLSHIRGLLQRASSWRSMEPGNGGYWYYSNFGLCVLGTTLELACDGLLEDYLQERFLKPVGAEASFFANTLDRDMLANIYSGGGVGLSIADQANQKSPTEIGQSASYFPGGFTVSAVDMAKLVSVLANDGVYKRPEYIYTVIEDLETGAQIEVAEPLLGEFVETRLLSEESVADMEAPRFTVDPIHTSVFDQCLILRRQEDLLGQEVLYYHTGSAYGVFTLMTYNPETRNGVVVLTTGTPRNMNDRGLYALCADLSEKLYEKMEGNPV